MRRFSRLTTAAGALVAGLAVLVAPGAAAAPEPTRAVPDTGQPPAEPTRTVSGTGQAEPGTASGTTIVERKRLAGGATVSTVRIGPIIARPHSEHDGGEHGTHTTVAGPVMPPCANCYITSIKPDLTYADGSSANYDTGVMLHHAVLFDRSKQDVTCGDSNSFYELTGRRIFASGNERTGGRLPDGYGVKLGHAPMTWAVVELMNMEPEPQTVFLEATVRHVPASTPGMDEVTPVWLDAANCTGDSQHSVPAGESTTTWRWRSTLTGTVKAAGGHLHDGGRSLTLSNASTAQRMCTSEAGYGTNPAYMGHIESMSTCTGQHVGTVRKGEVLQLDSVYRMDHAADDVMTIMMAYIDEKD